MSEIMEIRPLETAPDDALTPAAIDGFVPTSGAVDPEAAVASSILALTDDGVVATDDSGRVVLVNPAASRLLGIEQSDAVGRPLVDLAAETAPADAAATSWPLDGEIVIRSPSGRRRFAEVRSTGVYAAGAPLTVYLVRDRTGERRADEERQLLQSMALAIGEAPDLQSALRLALEMVGELAGWTAGEAWLPDATGGTIRRGPAWAARAGFAEFHRASEGVAFLPGEGLPGRVWSSGRAAWVEDVLEDPDFVRASLAEASGLRTGIAIPVLAGRETVAVISFFHTEVRDRDARLIRLVSAVASQLGTLIQRRRAEEALQHRAQELARSNEELEQFAYVASHDHAERLRMVASYTQLLAKRYGDRLDGDALEFIGYAVEGVTRMQQLIHDLLSFSRVGTRGDGFEPTSLESIVDRVLDEIAPVAEEAGARITRDALPVVTADEDQLYQVFQNLIVNAVKFAGDEPPRVHIAARREPTGWTLSVSDNGIGIAREYWSRIFVLFQRLHSRAEYQGTGIGLALCKKIVERHGGTIWLDSEPGRGTTFHFFLPDRDEGHSLA
jgi:PAS domain S-box-containing protein